MGIFQCHVRFQRCSSYWLGILHMFDRKDLAALPAVLKLQPWQSCNFGNLSHLPPPRRSLRAYLSQELKARSFTSSGGLDFHTRQTKTIFTFRIVVPFCHVGRKIAAIAKMFKISCFCHTKIVIFSRWPAVWLSFQHFLIETLSTRSPIIMVQRKMT